MSKPLIDPRIPLRLRILTCTRCPLSENCRAPVPFHTDHPTPRFLVVGEAPGRMEDYAGKPFHGPAGGLLRKTLKRVGLEPSSAAYMNAVCCWPSPSGLRTPERSHTDACAQHLKDQLEAFDTSMVLLTGTTALRAILPSGDLKFVLGRDFHLYGKQFFTVWHPSYIQMNRQLYSTWAGNLHMFSLLVNNPDHYGIYPTCIYCNATRDDALQTCRRHRTRFERDSRWPTYKAQGQLFG